MLNGSKAIVLDCDGVIIDSEEYKIQTFKSLFVSFPDKLAEIDAYNRSERGVNRRIKFEYIYRNILEIPYTEATIEELARTYSHRLRQRLGRQELVDGVKDFLLQHRQPKFVASSSERDELKLVLQHHDILDCFDKVYDRTVKKTEVIHYIIKSLSIRPEELLFIGDARTDLAAAQETGASFIARSPYENLFPANVRRITSFRELLLQGKRSADSSPDVRH